MDQGASDCRRAFPFTALCIPDSLSQQRCNQRIEAHTFAPRSGDKFGVQCFRNPGHEFAGVPARAGSRDWMPEFFKSQNDASQCVHAIFNSLLGGFPVGTTLIEIGKGNEKSATFIFRQGSDFKRVLLKVVHGLLSLYELDKIFDVDRFYGLFGRDGHHFPISTNKLTMTRSMLPPDNSVLPRNRLNLFNPPVQWVATHCCKKFGGSVHARDSIKCNTIKQERIPLDTTAKVAAVVPLSPSGNRRKQDGIGGRSIGYLPGNHQGASKDWFGKNFCGG